MYESRDSASILSHAPQRAWTFRCLHWNIQYDRQTLQRHGAKWTRNTEMKPETINPERRECVREWQVSVECRKTRKALKWEFIKIHFVETPRKFIITKLSIRKLGSSSVLIIMHWSRCGLTDPKLCDKFTRCIHKSILWLIIIMQSYKELINL